MLMSVIPSGFRETQDRRRLEPRVIFNYNKRYNQDYLIPILPSYKHPKFIRASNIGIVFDLNVYTGAHFGLGAQITLNF